MAAVLCHSRGPNLTGGRPGSLPGYILYSCPVWCVVAISLAAMFQNNLLLKAINTEKSTTFSNI